ncbi:MAG: hypothetical protein U0165_13235 [Polyangiaceae bacterium]
MAHAKQNHRSSKTSHNTKGAHNPSTTTATEQPSSFERGEQLLEAMLPELVSVEPGDVSIRLLRAFGLVVNMRKWLSAAETLRPSMEDLLKVPPFTEMEKLAVVLDVVEHLSLGAKPSSVQQNLRKLTDDRLIPARRMLRTMIEPLVMVGLIHAEAVEQAREGRSTLEIAEDVLRLVTAMQSSWASIQGKTPIDRETLESTEKLAREAIHAALGMGTVPQASENELSRDDLLARAIVLALNLYASIRRAVQYVRGALNDADDFTPSPYVLRGGGRQRKSSDKTESPEEGEPPDDAVKPVEHSRVDAA